MNAWARTIVLAGAILTAGLMAGRGPDGANPSLDPNPPSPTTGTPGGPPTILGSTRDIEVKGPHGTFTVKARVGPDGRLVIDAADNPGAIK